jgi:hypothetical protein
MIVTLIYIYIWDDMTRYDMTWYDMTWYDMIRHDRTWYDNSILLFSHGFSMSLFIYWRLIRIISVCFFTSPCCRLEANCLWFPWRVCWISVTLDSDGFWVNLNELSPQPKSIDFPFRKDHPQIGLIPGLWIIPIYCIYPLVMTNIAI